eukprot:CAMPEP_0184335290 /NCGR_PEP_ID=MMETSP1089-20130417/3878_1 /TAXON_ID=38269 ORGANISM="Gloeochaete wittrockiana, Strain SAG46.84" /NCGR_SAMPLE_ID=MMETSP1089 /ASSEMBLY_ACC=CAM_ASM_000445 /LENGTH=449 /DNA_ID=CAMNT_0026659879 /DNA_START=8 /DNA_END=1357 /DNA_ORIENTATION=+
MASLRGGATQGSIYDFAPTKKSTAHLYDDPESDLDVNKEQNYEDEDYDVSDDESMTGDAYSKLVNPKGSVFYEAFFVVMPLFCGYAALFSMQSQVKHTMGISDCDAAASQLFGFAVSFLYLGNLIFRIGHNIFFFFMKPRFRVYLSMISMATSMMTLIVVLFITKTNTNIAAIFVAYGLGGLAVGSFEANILACITPLGKDTKFWAILAMPVGINLITIGGFIALTFTWVAENPGVIHCFVFVFVVIGILIFSVRIFRKAHGVGSKFSINEFFLAFTDLSWMKTIYLHCLALMCDMFFVSLFSPGVILYIYDARTVHLSWLEIDIQTNWFIAIYNTYFFLGDSLSRKVFYSTRIYFPPLFLLLSITGMAIGLANLPEIVPICAFFVAFANGSIYAQTNRRIDRDVSEKLNLIALSSWLFLGDIGSVVGSNLIQYIAEWFHHRHHIAPSC